VRTAIGVIALFACSRLSLRSLETLAPWLLAGACIMLVLVVVTGHMTNGATRWLRVGFMSLHPTDLGRLAAVIFLAWWLKRRPIAELGSGADGAAAAALAWSRPDPHSRT
jgi:cell division protein FtsW (lipid II flippase)